MRLQRLLERWPDIGTEALLVTDRYQLQWLTGFTGSSGFALLTPSRQIFVTDSRYSVQAEQEVLTFEVVSFSTPKTQGSLVTSCLSELKVKSVGFDGTKTTVAQAEAYKKANPDHDWIAIDSQINKLRMVKDESEISAIQEACGITDAALKNVQRLITPGITEYDIQLDLEFFVKRQSAGLAFDYIVVSGENSARPHGHATEKRLEIGDFVTIDFGATVRNYHSDITRTFVVGAASDRQVEIYNQVLKAQIACVEAIRPGKTTGEIDDLARTILNEKGLAKYFGHGLGHGLGLEVHDPGRLAIGDQTLFEPGQVWTVEPGVYIPGFGGLRIEDDVLVTEDGVKLLTHFPKHLTVLGA